MLKLILKDENSFKRFLLFNQNELSRLEKQLNLQLFKEFAETNSSAEFFYLF